MAAENMSLVPIQRLNSGLNAAQLLFHDDANNAQALRFGGGGAAPQHHAMDKTQFNSPESAADFFESSLTLESSHYDKGYADGYRDGVVSGKRDGHEVGLKNGFEMGEELGFYQGLVDVWLSAIRVDPSCFSTRVQKNIHQMSQLLENYPVQDPESDSVDEMQASLRLKLRAVSVTLGVKLEYDGYPKTSSIGFSTAMKKPSSFTDVDFEQVFLGREDEGTRNLPKALGVYCLKFGTTKQRYL